MNSVEDRVREAVVAWLTMVERRQQRRVRMWSHAGGESKKSEDQSCTCAHDSLG